MMPAVAAARPRAGRSARREAWGRDGGIGAEGDVGMKNHTAQSEGFHLELLGPLLAEHPVTELGAGTLLFTQGEPADRFFLLVEGRVKLFSADVSGTENILHVFEPGDFFGLPAMLGPKRYPVNGETMTRARLLILQRAEVLDWLSANPEQVPNLLALLGQRYEGMLDALASLKTLSPRQRLCRYLIDVGGTAAPLPRSGPCRFRLPLAAHLIGGKIGLAPENVSRAFAWLRGHGVVVNRGDVQVADMAVLRNLAGIVPDLSSDNDEEPVPV